MTSSANNIPHVRSTGRLSSHVAESRAVMVIGRPVSSWMLTPQPTALPRQDIAISMAAHGYSARHRHTTDNSKPACPFYANHLSVCEAPVHYWGRQSGRVTEKNPVVMPKSLPVHFRRLLHYCQRKNSNDTADCLFRSHIFCRYLHGPDCSEYAFPLVPKLYLGTRNGCQAELGE